MQPVYLTIENIVMKIEEEIKQKKFRNEYQKLAINLMFTHSWLFNHQSEFFDKFGITASQFNILRILRGQYPNPASINLLKDRMLDKMSDASRLVERLRKKKFVERQVCPNDRRQANVIITDSGLKLLEEIDKLNPELDKLLKTLTKKEAAQLNDLLDKLRG